MNNYELNSNFDLNNPSLIGFNVTKFDFELFLIYLELDYSFYFGGIVGVSNGRNSYFENLPTTFLGVIDFVSKDFWYLDNNGDFHPFSIVISDANGVDIGQPILFKLPLDSDFTPESVLPVFSKQFEEVIESCLEWFQSEHPGDDIQDYFFHIRIIYK